MKNIRFPIRAVLMASLAFVGGSALAATTAAADKAHASARKGKVSEPAKPVGQVVEYPELENRVGQELVIETTFKTTRSGKLIKYTQPTLTLQIGSEAQPLELTVPRETIKTITVIPPPAATDKDAGTSGAKKN